jgi:DNA-binding NarL/FixJ family response regulator
MVAGMATYGEEAIEQAKLLQPRVAVIDLRLKWQREDALPAQSNGVRLAAELRQLVAPPAILVVTGFLEPVWVQRLADAGARGCMAKEDEPEAIVLAVRALAAGLTAWTPSQLELLRTNRLDTLSPREQEVLNLLDKGHTNAEIGRLLNITVGAVNKHVEHVFDKLGTHTRIEAIKMARERGLLGDN